MIPMATRDGATIGVFHVKPRDRTLALFRARSG